MSDNIFNYFTRVNFKKSDLLLICQKICTDYELGDLIKFNIIETGYEDFNVKMTTNKNNYVIKFFAKNRTLDNINHYVKIVEIIDKNNTILSCPKVYKYDNKILGKQTINSKNIYYFVMEFVNGKTIYDLKKDVDLKTLIKITFDLLKYNCVNIELQKYLSSEDAKQFKQYDMWGYENFIKEYKKKSKYLQEEDKRLLTKVVDYFNNMQLRYDTYDKYFANKGVIPPYMSAHNDFISTNILIDENKKPHYIDFSVSSVALNFVDIAIFGSDSLMAKNITASKYAKYLKIVSYILYRAHIMEYNYYPSAVAVQHAIHVLIANYYKVCKNIDSDENNYFLNLGRRGLSFIEQKGLLNVPVFNWAEQDGWFIRAELSNKSEFAKLKQEIKHLGLEELIEKELEVYHKLYNDNFGNDKFKPIKNTNTSDNGYDFLFNSLNDLRAGERFGEISFCREHEWSDSPEEEQWLKCLLNAAERGVKIQIVIVYKHSKENIIKQKPLLQHLLNNNNKNLKIQFISLKEFRNCYSNEFKKTYPGVLVFNNDFAYLDVKNNENFLGFINKDKNDLKLYNDTIKILFNHN